MIELLDKAKREGLRTREDTQVRGELPPRTIELTASVHAFELEEYALVVIGTPPSEPSSKPSSPSRASSPA